MQTQPTVLVTGATGFVGRRLVDYLLTEGAGVRILRQGPLPVPERWQGAVDIRDGDLTQFNTLKGIAAGIETVYHLAGEIRVAHLFDAVNRAGTKNLLRRCQSEGVRRFLYFSSVGVIGSSGKNVRVDETTPSYPRGAYERSKYAGERAALSYHQSGAMSVSVLRPSIIFGEGKDPRTDRFYLLLRMIDRGRFVLLGQKYVSSYVYVGDVVAAAVIVANHRQTGGQVYIINEPVPLAEFIGSISEILGRRKVPVLPPEIGGILAMALNLTGRFSSLYSRTVFSMDKLSGLGFRLPFGYRQGLRQTIPWYRGILGGQRPGSV